MKEKNTKLKLVHQPYKTKKDYVNKIILCRPKIKVQIHETKIKILVTYAIKHPKCQFHANQDQILEPWNRKTSLNLNALEIE